MNVPTALALLALFVSLGGAGYAATVAKKNSVASKSIKDGQVKTRDLADGAVTAPKLALQSIVATELSPSLAAGLRDRCPSDMTKIGSTLCFDKAARGLRGWHAAAETCAISELRLPTVSELVLARRSGLLAPGASYWTDVAYRDAGVGEVDLAVYVQDVPPTLSPVGVGAAANLRYTTCARAPSNG